MFVPNSEKSSVSRFYISFLFFSGIAVSLRSLIPTVFDKFLTISLKSGSLGLKGAWIFFASRSVTLICFKKAWLSSWSPPLTPRRSFGLRFKSFDIKS